MALGSACGSSSSKSSAPATTTDFTSTSASPEPDFTSDENCRRLSEIGVRIAQAINPSAAGGAASGTLDKELQEMTDDAPAGIRADFKTFVGAYLTFSAALKASGYKVTAKPTAAQLRKLNAAAAVLSTPQVEAAEKRLTAWGKKNCVKQ